MKTIIHVNQHVIKANAKSGARDPVLTVKQGDKNTYCHEVTVHGETKIVYSPDCPLSCGAKVWIETNSPVSFGEGFTVKVKPPRLSPDEEYSEASQELNVAINRHREFGTGDSEPVWKMDRIFDLARQGKDADVPASARDWELYAHKPGAGKAAAKLTSAVKRVVRAIKRQRKKEYA
jgi:hypothetical protein